MDPWLLDDKKQLIVIIVTIFDSTQNPGKSQSMTG